MSMSDWAARRGYPVDRTETLRITYPFPLRDDFRVKLELPSDLTVGEAERIAAYVRSLALEEESRG